MKEYFILIFTFIAPGSFEYKIKSFDKIEDGNGIVFPEQIPPRKQEIPLELIRRLNEQQVFSIDDFMDNFIESDNSSIAYRMGFELYEKSAVMNPKMAECKPELKTIPLTSGKDSTIFYYPSCTRIERCGGCCAHRLLSCQPVESEVLHFSVIAAEYRGGKQLKFKGKQIVQIERHKKCRCDCKIQPEHCTRYQKYNKEKCSCECNNTDDEKKCYAESRNKIWNGDLCACTCKEELECGSGFYFDPFQCRCEQARGQRKNLEKQSVGIRKKEKNTFLFIK